MTTATVQKWSFSVIHNAYQMTVTSAGGKKLVINMQRWGQVELTPEEHKEVKSLYECWGHGQRYQTTLTREQCDLLVSASAKMDAAVSSGRKGARTNPAAPPSESEANLRRAQEEIVNKTHRRSVGGGQTTEEDKLNRLAQTVKTLEESEEMWLVKYDIPDELLKDCPNPSWWMWSYGFRLEKSVWCMTEKMLNTEKIQCTLALWREKGVITHVLPIAERATKELRLIARQAYEAELKKLHKSLITRLDRAHAAWQKNLEELGAEAETVTTTEEQKLEDAYHYTTRKIIEEVAVTLNNCIAGAMQYDEDESLMALIEATRDVHRAEALNWNAAARLRNVPVTKQIAVAD